MSATAMNAGTTAKAGVKRLGLVVPDSSKAINWRFQLCFAIGVYPPQQQHWTSLGENLVVSSLLLMQTPFLCVGV